MFLKKLGLKRQIVQATDGTQMVAAQLMELDPQASI
jgi:hypothetical protein